MRGGRQRNLVCVHFLDMKSLLCLGVWKQSPWAPAVTGLGFGDTALTSQWSFGKFTSLEGFRQSRHPAGVCSVLSAQWHCSPGKRGDSSIFRKRNKLVPGGHSSGATWITEISLLAELAVQDRLHCGAGVTPGLIPPAQGFVHQHLRAGGLFWIMAMLAWAVGAFPWL